MTQIHDQPEPVRGNAVAAPASLRRLGPLSVLLISDGVLGHYRQSEGIVAALRRAADVALTRLELGTRMPLPKALLPRLGRLLSPSRYLHWVHRLDPADLARPDVIVSAGGATLGANVALARIWQTANVYSGSTRGFPPEAFRLVVTPYASAGGPPNVYTGPKPTPFDPDPVPLPRPIRTPADLRGARVSLLIGGPIPQAAFDRNDWVRLAALIDELAGTWGCHVTVVTSRRTPAEAYDALRPVVARHFRSVMVIDFRSAGPGSIERAFDCELVLVTSDSMSMMTEAALSRRPAVALAPRRVRPCPDDEGVAALVEARWLASLPLATTDAARLAEAAASLVPMTDNHLDLLAQRLLVALDASHKSTRP